MYPERGTFSGMIALLAGVSLGFTQATWTITPERCLNWNGQPYIPFGLRIQGTAEEVRAAKATGFTDVLVELPSDGTGWGPAIQALEENGMKYMVTLSSMAPTMRGIAVEPESYRIPGITQPKVIDFKIPGATRAWVVVAAQRDSNIESEKQVNLRDGNFHETVGSATELESVMLLYPEFQRLAFPDFWDQLDQHRDGLIRALKNNPFGPGMRGFINPLGTVLRFMETQPQIVPTSPVFHLELEAYLRKKYTQPETAMRAWSVGAPDFDSFQVMSRLVPLWSKTRGVPSIWDPATGKTYASNQRQSQIWADIREVIQSGVQRRYGRLVRILQDATKAPVIETFRGWDGPYSSVLNGFGVVHGPGSLTQQLDQSAQAVGMAASMPKPMLMVAPELKVSGGAPESQVTSLVQGLVSMGVRGFYINSTDQAVLSAFKAEGSRQMASGLSGWSINPIFYPAEAANPAAPMTLPGGRWWLPRRGGGSRIDLGPSFTCYQLAGGEYLLWRNDGTAKTRIKATKGQTISIRPIQGGETPVKAGRGFVEFVLGSTPVVVSGTTGGLVPMDALDSTLGDLARCFAAWGNKIPNADQEAMSLKDQNAALERSPGAAMKELRTMLMRITKAMGPVIWAEAESTQEHSMSENAPFEGASGGRVLSVRSRIPTQVAPLRAKFSLRARQSGSHEIWLAARLPVGSREALSVLVGDRVLRIESEPVSPYGEGFAWYRLGDVALTSEASALEIFLDSRQSLDLDLDVLVASPLPFRPDGLRLNPTFPN